MNNSCLIVVGSGPVAIKFVKALHKRQPSRELKVFGDEPWKPYDRVRLTSVLSGDISEQDIFDSEELPESEKILTYWNNRIESIDVDEKTVTDSLGEKHYYSELILALGSQPRIPDIEGIHLKNIFSYRNLDDARALLSRQVKTRRTIILGGGLLGLEAARAMQRFNTEVICIEHSSRLLYNQIDNKASNYLEKHLNDLYINTEIRRRVVKFTGENNKVSEVHLENGESIKCDTVILSTGIKPNIKLARDASIHVSRGIRIDDSLQTNVDNVYAIGECAEHKGKVYGLVGPGYEQATILAEQLSDNNAQYLGSTTATQLKVLDYPVLSVGSTEDDIRLSETYTYENPKTGQYRKLILSRSHLKGVVAVGKWSAKQRIQEMVDSERFIWPWQKLRFKEEGELWPVEDSQSVASWPANAMVCNCKSVTRGALSIAIENGCKTVDQLCTATGASTVCGTCRPLLEDLTQSTELPPRVSGSALLLGSAIITLLVSIFLFFMPAFSVSPTVQGTRIDLLWQDSFIKKLTGFTLLGMSIFIMLLSVRKRFEKFNFGEFKYWRVVHVCVGVLVFVVLFMHTGFHLGSKLNMLLMLSFSGLMLVGAVASGVISLEHKLPRAITNQLRKMSIWTHILLFWPIPALLIFHVFKSYYY